MSEDHEQIIRAARALFVRSSILGNELQSAAIVAVDCDVTEERFMALASIAWNTAKRAQDKIVAETLAKAAAASPARVVVGERVEVALREPGWPLSWGGRYGPRGER